MRYEMNKGMHHDSTKVLMKCQPAIIRRRSTRQIWTMILMVMFFTFLLESLFYFNPLIPEMTSNRNDVLGNTLLTDSEDFDSHVLHFSSFSLDSGGKTRDEHSQQDVTFKTNIVPEKTKQSKRVNDKIEKQNVAFKEDIVLKRKIKESKWMVVFSNGACDVSHFTRVPGWNVVVTGSKPESCEIIKHCTYIDSATEKELGYRLRNLLKDNSGAKKMIGYLYAISKGAKAIYDVNCEVIPKFNKIEFELSGNTSGLGFTGGPIFNPYAHFGFPMLYPRGFPDNSRVLKGQGRYQIVENKVPIIQQGQVNFELASSDVGYVHMSRKFNVTFDRSSPPVILSGHRYGPINSENTVFLYDAFWALFLPSVSKSDSDIVRGYIAQRLLNYVGGTVAFTSSTAFTPRRGIGQNRFVLSKKSTNTYLEKLISVLRRWKCESSVSLLKCAGTLVDVLVSGDLLSKSNSVLFKAWMLDLESVGYKEPMMRPFVSPVSNPGLWNPLVMYDSPKVIPSEIHLRTDLKTNTYQYSLGRIHTICPRQNYTISRWMNPPITDILLVVIFNYDFLIKLIPNMEFTHRIYFRHILYCGPDFKGLTQLRKQTGMHHVAYVNGVDKDTWFFTYQCLVHAASMNLNVKGYLYIGDDILLNTWNIVDLPRDKFWMQPGNPPIARSQLKHRWWFYWDKPVGRKAVNLFMDEILSEHKKNSSDSMLTRFIQMYDKNVNISRALHHSIDVFYAPAIYNKELIRFGKIFRKHKVLLGLAVPMLHTGLVDTKDVVILKGTSLWKKNREKNQESFQEDKYYLHPFKMLKDVSQERGRVFFCDTYMRLAIEHLDKIKTKSRQKKR